MTITQPAVHDWDNEDIPLVDVEPVEPAQPAPKPKRTRKPKQAVDVASATGAGTEISVPASGTIRLVVDNGNVTVLPEAVQTGPRRLGGVTRENGLISPPSGVTLPMPTTTPAPAAAPTTAATVQGASSKASDKQVCLEIRLTPRAAFLASFSLIWTLVLAKGLGAL